MSIPRDLCLFPIGTVRSPKCLPIVSVNIYSILHQCVMPCFRQHTMLSWIAFPLMVIFSIHLSYRLTTSPCDFRVFEHISYHISEDSTHPYIYFISRRYSTFNPFYPHTFFNAHGSPHTWFPQIRLKSLARWTYLLAWQNSGMHLGH